MQRAESGGADWTFRRKGGVSPAGRRRAARGLLRLAGTMALAAVLCMPAWKPALAQGPGSFLQLSDSESGVPMLVHADEMIYDYDLDQVIASGNVEIYYDQYALTAQRVIYDKRNDTVTATDKVRLKQPDGNVMFTDYMVITGDFREGFVRSLSSLTPENARLAAASARRIQGNLIIFNRGVYTACEISPDQPEKPPIWQIKAVKVIHNQTEKIVEYEDVTFEVAGTPVFYAPYFRHPDPTVRRKSGFLPPLFKISSLLGPSIEVPYFWALAPNYDVTFHPRITGKQGVLMQTEWRHRLIHGSYSIRAAGIFQTDPDAFIGTPGERRVRGSVRSLGAFRINDYWTTGWNITAASDDTFQRVYGINLESEQVSEIHLTGMSERNYFDVRAMHLKNYVSPPTFFDPVTLRTVPFGTPIDPATGGAFLVGGMPLPAPQQPLVHPVLDYNYLFEQPVMGGELGFNVHSYSLTRDIGPDASRLIGEVNWRRTFTDQYGQQFTPFFNVRGDVYYVDNVFDATVPGGLRDQEAVARGMATAGINYSYPFISTHSWGSQVIEPMAQLIVRPNPQNGSRIPNEDARSLVFDDTILFEPDKFSGFDEMEGGARANVGVRYTVQTNEWGYGTVLLGQSFHLAGDNPFDPATGLGGTASDFVGAVFLEPIPLFGVSTQFRLDRDTLEVRRHDMKGWVRYAPVFASVVYSKYMQDPAPGVVADREELLTSATLNLATEWQLSGTYRYDITRATPAEASIGLAYICDCATVRVTYAESYARDRDFEPNRTLSLYIELKTLGATTISTGMAENLSNDL